MRDVAELAGVSVATVSRVISDSSSVQRKTRERVLAAMAELDYVLNGLAQSMQGKGTRAIGFLVNRMVGPTFADLASGVEEEVSGNGGLLTILTTHGAPEQEMEALRQMREQRAKAVLLVGASPTSEEYTERLRKYRDFLAPTGTKLILCARGPVPGVDGVDSVYYENRKGMRTATEHLLAQGHRNIVFLGAETNHSTAIDRLDGFVDAFRSAGLEPHEQLILRTAFDPDPAEAALEELIKAKVDFTAVVAARDELAVRALRVFRRHGIKVPDDVSLLGYDDMLFVGDLTPSLTTVRVPYRELGRHSGKLVDGNSTAGSTQVLPVEFITRESTGPAQR